MRRKWILACGVSVSLLLSGCANNADTGAFIGSVLGAALGAAVSKNKAQGAVIGGLIGGVAGYGIGRVLDERERRELTEASYRAAAEARTGERVEWGDATYQQDTPTAQPARPEPEPYEPPRRHHRTRHAGGTTRTPTNPSSQSSASGWVIPLNDPYVVANGQTCRDLQQVATKNGQTYSQNVRACNSGSGWVVPQV